jgi:hypothetical protein
VGSAGIATLVAVFDPFTIKSISAHSWGAEEGGARVEVRTADSLAGDRPTVKVFRGEEPTAEFVLIFTPQDDGSVEILCRPG